MKALVLLGFVTAVGAAGVMWRRSWLDRADALVESEIERNRARYRKGMRVMDEALRDRTTAQRREREQQIEAFTRELHNERPRLHRAS